MINFNHIVRWCAEEVSRQKDGPLAVADMFDGLDYMMGVGYVSPLTEEIVLNLHQIVMPDGPSGWARVPRVFANGNKGVDPSNIERAITNLIEAINEDEDLTMEEAYREFETIHPFVDGNGRVGAILYNWMRGSLDSPVSPPDLFS